MKYANPLFLVVAVSVAVAAIWTQAANGGEHRKTLADCITCKRPVYSYYRFKTYENNAPVYAWEISGHSNCRVTASDPEPSAAGKKASTVVANNSLLVNAAYTKAKSTAKSAAKGKGQKEAKADHDSEKSTQPYASHRPIAYGGGSGYGRHGYGGYPLGGHHCQSTCGHVSPYFGNPFHPGAGYGGTYSNGYGYGYGLGYGSGTVTRTTRVTRSTPSTLGLFGGFPGRSTSSVTVRTRVSGGYGGIWGGYGYGGGRPCRY